MNAEPSFKMDLAGVDDVVSAEISILREDVRRLERQHKEASHEQARLSQEIASLDARRQALQGRFDELQLRSGTVRRMLHQRQRLIFDLQQENE